MSGEHLEPLTSRAVSIVLPVHRQVDHIERILDTLSAAAAIVSTTLEIIAVVNGDDDGSHGRCLEVAERDATVRVLHVPEPGWGRAVRAGLADSGGELLCYSNSARTSPADLRTALALGVLNHEYAIKAMRRSRDSLLRRSASVAYNLEARALFGLANWDINGTPKVFPREFTPLIQLREPGDLIDLEWLVACQRHGLPLLEFPVTNVRRHGGVSTTRVRSAFGMYVGAVTLKRRMAAADRRPSSP